jgi:hypothetical protein
MKGRAARLETPLRGGRDNATDILPPGYHARYSDVADIREQMQVAAFSTTEMDRKLWETRQPRGQPGRPRPARAFDPARCCCDRQRPLSGSGPRAYVYLSASPCAGGAGHAVGCRTQGVELSPGACRICSGSAREAASSGKPSTVGTPRASEARVEAFWRACVAHAFIRSRGGELAH